MSKRKQTNKASDRIARERAKREAAATRPTTVTGPRPPRRRSLQIGDAIGIRIHQDSTSEIVRVGDDLSWMEREHHIGVGGVHLEDGLAMHLRVRQTDPVNTMGTLVLRMFSDHAAPVRGPVFVTADAPDFTVTPLGNERADDLMTLFTIAWHKSRNPDLAVFDINGRVM